MTLHIFARRFLASLTIVMTLLAGFCAQVQAAQPAGVSVDMGYLVDPTRNLGLDEILGLAPDRFEPHPRPDFSFGYPDDAIWLRVAVRSDRDREVLLSMSPNFVDLIDIYVTREGSGPAASDFRHIASGDHRPMPADGISGLDDVAELDLRAGETQLVYIRIASVGSALTTHVQVYAKEERPLRDAIATLSTGMWFGSTAVLVIIQLIFFYYDRKPYYLLLAGSTFMASAVYMGTLGLSRLFLFPQGGPGNDIFVSVSIWLGLTASALAAASILELRKNSLWMYRFFLACAGVGLLGAAFGTAGLHMLFAPAGNLIGMALATLGAFQAMRTARSGGAATQLRAAAYGVLWIGVVAVMTHRTALVDLPDWVAHTYAVACVLQTILLTAALGVRLRTAENLNLVMQQQALFAAKAAEKHANALVEERTRELAAARQTAEDALQAELRSQQQQVRFMEVISHQYRTPLAAIRTHVDNIGLGLPEKDEANRGRLQRVRKGISRLVEVLEVNLARARLQGSSFRPVLHRIPVVDIVQTAATRGRDLLQSAIVTDIAPAAADMRVRADADMLGIAIINLLENAGKFSRSRTREPLVLACLIEGGHAAISVSDKGIGIPAGDLPMIFNPDRRGANAEGIEGSGMGLSLVARIATAHGGNVSIESAEGQGTTVTIRLPVCAD